MIDKKWYSVAESQTWLSPLSWIYKRGQSFDKAKKLAQQRAHIEELNQVRRAGNKVPFIIAVGNINVGGVGKTPTTLWLVNHLRSQGYRVAILTRGYGVKRDSKDVLVLDSHTPDKDPSTFGDEPVLLQKRTQVPVIICAERMNGLRKIIKDFAGVDIVVCDDALQHYQLPRDFEFAVVDASLGFGNGHLLPQGPLRELPARLGQCDSVLINGIDSISALSSELEEPLKQYTRQQDWLFAKATIDHGVSLSSGNIASIDSIRQQSLNKNIVAFAGIAHPEKFFSSLSELGFTFAACRSFSDHQSFSSAIFDTDLFESADYIFCTEKDAEKCRPFANEKWLFFPISLHFEAEALYRFTNKLGEKITSYQALHAATTD